MAKRKTKSDGKRRSQSSEPQFESEIEALQKIVADLELGQLSLGESLDPYEQGIRHLGNCCRS